MSFEKGDTEAAYNEGWNDCIGEAEEIANCYSRSVGTFGGDRVHYYKVGDGYLTCGNGWYKTTSITGYTLPSPK